MQEIKPKGRKDRWTDNRTKRGRGTQAHAVKGKG